MLAGWPHTHSQDDLGDAQPGGGPIAVRPTLGALLSMFDERRAVAPDGVGGRNPCLAAAGDGRVVPVFQVMYEHRGGGWGG